MLAKKTVLPTVERKWATHISSSACPKIELFSFKKVAEIFLVDQEHFFKSKKCLNIFCFHLILYF